MDVSSIVVPVIGISVAAFATFYVVSFSEIKNKYENSDKYLDDEDADDPVRLRSLQSNKEWRQARKEAKKQRKGT
ncbi:hypothetical protein CBR_g37245 [Chara braunii]|uniref:Uncharacterized protein n=1 Tax=Chara braunii TaxID=69332 RepID=A0A388LMG3_CHABU|nr:hypothetical protein CBR_g37245 [Chara braunii]|eukprot:GBG83530.1 hypothetical protein CBR_g37245 [Chara braunii]